MKKQLIVGLVLSLVAGVASAQDVKPVATVSAVGTNVMFNGQPLAAGGALSAKVGDVVAGASRVNYSGVCVVNVPVDTSYTVTSIAIACAGARADGGVVSRTWPAAAMIALGAAAAAGASSESKKPPPTPVPPSSP